MQKAKGKQGRNLMPVQLNAKGKREARSQSDARAAECKRQKAKGKQDPNLMLVQLNANGERESRPQSDAHAAECKRQKGIKAAI
ncbi:hypothetical protein [Niallia oryzisoli]|uniref:hypothetical protein n=1 Tax=Niallia oryzisoli TaxID=1737571 RepID=UPI0037357BF8